MSSLLTPLDETLHANRLLPVSLHDQVEQRSCVLDLRPSLYG